LSEQKSLKYLDMIKCTAGIYAAFISMGYFQERVAKTSFDGSYFDYPIFIVFINCLGTILTAILQIRFFPSGTKRLSVVPYKSFITSSFFLCYSNGEFIFGIIICKLSNTGFSKKL